jgi:hypothetical protein
MPAVFSGSVTRSHNASAWSKWRCASAGAPSRSASSPARTDAANAPGMSWLARQCWASSAAVPGTASRCSSESSELIVACSLVRSPGSRSA